MKMGLHTEKGRFVFAAGRSLNAESGIRRVSSPSSILGLALLAQQHAPAQSFVLSSGEKFECPSKEHELTLAIRMIYS